MTSVERIGAILRHGRVDRVGLFEVFWQETVQKWAPEIRFDKPEMVSEHFGLDLRRTGGEITPMPWKLVNRMANLDADGQLVEETETTKLVRDGNGAPLRLLKVRSCAPEHFHFLVKDRRGWEAYIRPRLLDERTYPRRIDFNRYRNLRDKDQWAGEWLTKSGSQRVPFSFVYGGTPGGEWRPISWRTTFH